MKNAGIFLLSMLMFNYSFCQKETLQMFKDYTGSKWIGHYQNSEDSSLTHIVQWKYGIDEHIVKMIKSVPELGFKMETNYYYDYEKNQISFISFTNKSINSKGKAEVSDKKIMLTGKTYFNGGFSNFEMNYEIDDTGKLIDKFYRIKNNNRIQGHLIEYKR